MSAPQQQRPDPFADLGGMLERVDQINARLEAHRKECPMKYIATCPDGTSLSFDAPGDGGALQYIFDTSPIARAEGVWMHARGVTSFAGVLVRRDEALEHESRPARAAETTAEEEGTIQ